MKLIPVILKEDARYVFQLNKEAESALVMMYQSQLFPDKGDSIDVKGWDPERIQQRYFVFLPETPMVYLVTEWPTIKELEEDQIFPENYEAIYKNQKEIIQ